MLKKIVSMLIVFAMLVPVSSVVAADNSNVQPTIEEILNSYHEKAFAASAEGGSEVSAYARRSGSEKTLEQETVDELTAAGYEAYNVTAENYEELEESLKMDFESMELNPESSYIIVISGEESNSAGNHSRAVGGGLGSLPEQDFIDDGAGSFTSYYNGTAYTLRYVTITTADESALTVSTEYDFAEIRDLSDFMVDLADTCLSIGVSILADGAVPFLNLGYVVSLLGVLETEDPLTITSPEEITIYAGTSWTRQYIQVRNENNTAWYSSLYVSYAVSRSQFIGGYVYDPEQNAPRLLVGPEIARTTYSAYCDDISALHTTAIEAYLSNSQFCYCTGDIDFYFVSDDGQINDGQSTDPLFTHAEPLGAYIPKLDYDE